MRVSPRSFFLLALPLLASILASCASPESATTVVETALTIQETSSLAAAGGFVSTTGSFSKSKSGYQGSGYIDNLGSADSNIVYSVHADAAVKCRLFFRYAFAGYEDYLRDAYVVVNGARAAVDDDEVLEFAYTGNWASWADSATVSVSLVAGDNNIRIQPAAGRTRVITPSSVLVSTAVSSDGTITASVHGLPNIDYLRIIGAGISTGSNSTVFFTLSASVKDASTGSVSLSPEQDFYLAGTQVTLRATPSAGYAFESWTGTVPSSSSSYSLAIDRDMSLVARFLPTGTRQQAGLVGFGAVQDDLATPYVLTGGLGAAGETSVTSLAELEAALSASAPAIVRISGLIATPGEASVSINVASNKTILSDASNQGHLKNIELKFSGENYIVRNLIFSEVIAADVYKGAGNDCLQLNGARHVWIDHCELYSSLGPSPIDVDGNGVINDEDSKDYYDGLLDIKNGASFITVSYCFFHDHWKAILVGSGDDDTTVSDTRLTMHHNFFEHVQTRTPLIRFGKAHVYNNYYLGSDDEGVKEGMIDSTVNSRSGAEVFVEGNYFENCKDTIGFYYGGSVTGTWNVLDNTFSNVTNATTASTGSWKPAYAYAAEASAGLCDTIPGTVGAGVLNPAP
jgi:pectate lyase